MLYSLKQGPTEKRLIKQALRSRRKIPKEIAEAPSLQLGLEMYYDAFWNLDTCRQNGFGAGPISWAVIRDYAQTFGYDEEQTDDLFHFIRVMDNAYLDFHAPKETKTKKGQKISGRK